MEEISQEEFEQLGFTFDVPDIKEPESTKVETSVTTDSDNNNNNNNTTTTEIDDKTLLDNLKKEISSTKKTEEIDNNTNKEIDLTDEELFDENGNLKESITKKEEDNKEKDTINNIPQKITFDNGNTIEFTIKEGEDYNTALNRYLDDYGDNVIEDVKIGLPKIAKDIIDISKSGGDVIEYIEKIYSINNNNKVPLPTTNEINIEDEVGKEVAVKTFLVKVKNLDPDEAQDLIDTYKTKNILDNKSKEAFELLKKNEDEIKEKEILANVEIQKRKEENSKNFKKFIDEVKKEKIIGGVEIDVNIEDYLKSVDEKTKTAKIVEDLQTILSPKEMTKEVVNKLSILATLLKNNFNLEKLVDKAAEKKVTNDIINKKRKF